MADDNDVVYPLTDNDDLIATGLVPEDDDDIYDDAATLLGIDVGRGSALIDLDGGALYHSPDSASVGGSL